MVGTAGCSLKKFGVPASLNQTLGVVRMERHYRTWTEALEGWDGGSGGDGGGGVGSRCSEEGG